MQTVYYTTANFIRHQGNLVDLTEYRRKLGRIEEEQLWAAPQPREEERPRVRRRGHTDVGLLLDFCTSGAILAMTVTVAAKVLGAM